MSIVFETEILTIQNNHLTGTITDSICEKLDPSAGYLRLLELSVDCDLISCTCCSCYINGTLVGPPAGN